MISLRQQTKQRIEIARRRLIREIESIGTTIHWKEPIYTSDGANGKILVREENKTVRGILINSNAADNMNMTESGRKETGTHKLITLYSEHIRPEYLTEFYTKDNEQYRVVSCRKLNGLNIAFVIYCIHTPAHMEGY